MRRMMIAGVIAAMLGTLGLMVLSLMGAGRSAWNGVRWLDGLKDQQSIEQRVSRTFSLQQVKALDIEADAEDIDIQPTDAPALTVTAICAGTGATAAEARQHADRVRWTSSLEGTTLRVRPEAGQGGGHLAIQFNGRDLRFNEGIVRFVIAVPRSAQLPLTVRTDSGDVNVHGGNRGLSLHTDSGDSVVREVSGALDLKAESGEVRVTGGTGDSRVRSDSGDVAIALRQAGEVLQVETESGNVLLTQSAKPAKAQRCRTTSGDVELLVPPTASMAFDLAAEHGDIDNALTSARAEDTARLTFQMGASDSRVEVRTESGDITLKPLAREN